MKFFRKILKNKLFYLVLLLGVFLTPIFNFTLQAQESYDDDGLNLASPNLEGKEYLGDGVYRVSNLNGITVDYNVFNGEYEVNGTSISSGFISNDIFTPTLLSGELTVKVIYISGEKSTPDSDIIIRLQNLPTITASFFASFKSITNNYDNQNTAMLWISGTGTFTNYKFTLQLEKGDTATPYQLPIQSLKQHVQLRSDDAFNDGYDIGYDDGHSDGYESGGIDGYNAGYDDGDFNGYSRARDEYGYYDVETNEWLTAEEYGQKMYDDGYALGVQYGYDQGEYDGYTDGYDIGYDIGYDDGEIDGYSQARDEYGYYDVETDQWLTAVERGLEMYDRGYQDGVDVTNAYYNDNGLFIPQLTPKAHLVAEGDQRYDDPYFYLRDFSGQIDNEYFGFEHNRWLEKAFNWAYSVESDFLAFNDVYIIKYKNDEVLYKYFFYKYDTDSIYFYGESGALLKIVERTDFDYFIYEAPELPLEEQNRIDNAYDKGYNNARSEYGYYDRQNEEYLTAIEYGEIQYNLGVISIRDKAYFDGFYTAMKDSHKYGFDWVRATYWELIDESLILQNLRDETSFTYQSGHTEGFNEARGRYGYWDGRVWVTAESVRAVVYTEAYDSGFRDATNELYDDLYDDIYDIGYRDGQRMGANNKFYTGLEKWLVPAIIVVLFFGLLMLFPKRNED